jgi:hypothetical protein
MVFIHHSSSAVTVIAIFFISHCLSPHPHPHTQLLLFLQVLPSPLLFLQGLPSYHCFQRGPPSYYRFYAQICSDFYSQPPTGFFMFARSIIFVLLYATSTQSSYHFNICPNCASSTQNSFRSILFHHFHVSFISSLPLTSSLSTYHTSLLCLLFMLKNLASSTLLAMATIISSLHYYISFRQQTHVAHATSLF